MAKSSRNFQVPRAWRNLTLNIPLKVNGVSIPLTVNAGITSAMRDGSGIKAHQICETHKCGVKQKWWCEDGQHMVTPIKAYEYGGQDVELLDSEMPNTEQDGQVWLKAIMPSSAIDPIYYDSPYIIWPTDNQGAQMFDTILAALCSTDSCMVGTTVLGKGTKVIVLRYSGALDTLVAHTCTFDARIKVADVQTARAGYSERDTPADPEIVAGLHMSLMESLDNTWDPTQIKDDYSNDLEARLAEKIRTGQVTVKAEAPRTVENTPNLFDVLREQMAADKKPAPKSKKTSTKKDSTAKV